MRTLKTRITWLTTSLVLALLGGVGWFEDRNLGSDYTELLHQQQGTLAQTVADDLDDRLAMHVAALERLAHQLRGPGPGGRDADALRRKLVDSGLRTMFDGVGIVGLDGSMQITDRAAGNTPGAPVNLADRGYFRQAVASGQAMISPPVVSRTTGQPVVVMVVPLRDDAGALTGLVGATLSLARPNVLGRLAQARVGETGYYTVSTREAEPRYVVHPDPGRLLQPAAQGSSPIRGDADVITRAVVRGPGWELRAVLPAAEAMAPLHAARRRLLLQMALLGLACGALAWFGSRALLRPLDRLLNAMRELRTSPDAPVALDLDGQDERGEMAREFDALMSALRERQAELAASIEASPLGLFQAAADGDLRDVNDKYLQILGLPRETAAQGWLGLIEPEARDAAWAAWINIVSNARSAHVERRLLRHDGRSIVVSMRTAPVIVQGRVVGHTGTIADITDRVEAAQAVRTLAAILESTPDLVVQTDAKGQLVYMNPAARRRNGLVPDAPIDHLGYREFNSKAMLDRHRDEIVPAALTHGVWVGETEGLDLLGRTMPCAHTLIAHRDAEGQLTHFSAIQRDISAEKTAADALRRQADMLRTLAETMRDMVAVVDSDERFVFANQAYERYFGAAPGGLLGRHVREVLGDADYQRSRVHVARALAGATVVYDKESMRDERRVFEACYTPVRGEDGQVRAYVVVGRDVTEQRHEQSRLRDLAERDPMTGLLNRAGFGTRLAQLCRTAADGEGSLAVLYLDLDRFKEVNDTHGHGVGDELLRIFAKRLDHLVRPSDAVSRLGGDEFAIALANVRTLQNAERVADKVLQVAHEPFHVGHVTLHIGASVGLALWRPGDGEGAPLLQRADEMLYRAKQGGRGRRASAEALH